MDTRTININVTTSDVQGMVDIFMHLHNTLGEGLPGDDTPPAARRLLENAACMMLKITEAHPDSEALKAIVNRENGYDPLEND